ncbi:SDR family NAD(P)-dependent oxidoreductase [Pseudomonas sp. CT11-2]|uniref:SDR family NAD(P)-dependent oxidoreductase n=1 Tax=Pseudomonas sp. CT11-2 TaxID=3243023 RepID=UPI0039B0C92D
MIDSHSGERPALRFDGKVALITGAGRGLGRTYALLLAARGARLVVNDPGVSFLGGSSQESPAHEVVQAITAAGGIAVANCQSVTDAPNQIVNHAIEAFGRLDIVINNAGITGGGAFAEIPKEEFDRVLEVHVQGTLGILRAAWPHLIASGSGRVLNTSSQAVFGAPGTSPYAAAKSTIFGLCRTLAAEGSEVGIHVNTIMPSAYTRMTALVPDDRFRQYLIDHYRPESVAAFVVWLLHHSTRLSGETFSVGGGQATRVMLVENQGYKVLDDVPEAWLGSERELLRQAELQVPVSMMDELRLQARRLGPEAVEAHAALQLDRADANNNNA